MNVLPNAYICPFRKKSASFLPEGSVKCTLLAASIASSQRMLTEIKESGAIAKTRISVENCQTFKGILNNFWRNANFTSYPKLIIF